jgi:hypothetical protein
VLGLLALFTHMHIFWVAGLLLALIDFPDIGGWLARIAGSVEKIAGVQPGEATAQDQHETGNANERSGVAAEQFGKHDGAARRETTTRSLKHHELSHA